jgi:hemoglobin
MTLYEKIGGAPVLTAAVGVFYARVSADPDLAPWFADVDIERLKAHQRAFLAVALGGPDTFTGRSMPAAHAGLGITVEAFDRVLEHLAYTLFDLGLSYHQVTTVVDGLRGQARGIVEAETAETVSPALRRPAVGQAPN